MNLTVRGKLRDLLAFIRLIGARRKVFRKTAIRDLTPGKMNILSEALHPRHQLLRIEEVREETPSARTYRLVPAEKNGSVAFFRAGQYIAVEDVVDGTPVSRPFSISSTPDDAADRNFYEITVKKSEAPGQSPDQPAAERPGRLQGRHSSPSPDNSPVGSPANSPVDSPESRGFFAPWALEHWKPGHVLTCSEPAGNFSYEPLRDSPHLMCIAGGSGITPFRSLIKDTLTNYEETRCTLIYGVTEPSEFIYGEEWRRLEEDYPERFSMAVVYSGKTGSAGESGGAFGIGSAGVPEVEGAGVPEVEAGRKKLITAELIRELMEKQLSDGAAVTEETSFFVCGPPAMHYWLENELKEFHLPPKRLRRENYGQPASVKGGEKSYSITVLPEGRVPQSEENMQGGTPTKIRAIESETVLIALERAGFNPPALCRSGECGWCRSRLFSGEVYVPAENDGRRMADRKFGWFHPCSSYPRSDIVIWVPEKGG